MTSIYHQIKKDNATIQKDIITNIVKMIAYRKWILNEPSYIENLTNSLLKDKNEENIFNIKLPKSLKEFDTYEANDDRTTWEKFSGNNVYILMVHQKISGKSQVINDFLTKYYNNHKIIIVEDITEKGRQIILSFCNNRFTEIFIENEFMINLTEHVCSPQYEVLTQQQADEIKNSYKMTKKQTPKMYSFDPAAKYLYIKKGQIVRIIRNSIMTGESIGYRLVIHKGSTATTI